MSFDQIKAQLAAYMGRSQSAFIVNGVDLLGMAVNNARKFAERKRHFELARCSVILPSVSTTTGASLSSAVALDGTTPVAVKAIERAYLTDSSGGQFPIETTSRARYTARVGARYAEVGRLNETIQRADVSYFALVQLGDTVFVAPAPDTNPFVLTLDVVRWMPEYRLPTDEDFFLQHGADFLLYRSILELNFLLKEDQRVVIGSQAVDQAWVSLVDWDSQLVDGGVDSVNLD